MKSVCVPHGHPGLFLWSGTDAKGERRWKQERKKKGYQLRRVSRSQSCSIFSSPHLMVVCLGITVFRMFERPPRVGGTECYCCFTLNSVHAKTLNASTAICFALATKCTWCCGSAQCSTTEFCTNFFSRYTKEATPSQVKVKKKKELQVYVCESN